MTGPCFPASFVDVKFACSNPSCSHQATWKDVRIGDILLNFADEAKRRFFRLKVSKHPRTWSWQFVQAFTFRIIQVSDPTSN